MRKVCMARGRSQEFVKRGGATNAVEVLACLLVGLGVPPLPLPLPPGNLGLLYWQFERKCYHNGRCHDLVVHVLIRTLFAHKL